MLTQLALEGIVEVASKILQRILYNVPNSQVLTYFVAGGIEKYVTCDEREEGLVCIRIRKQVHPRKDSLLNKKSFQW